MKYETGSEVWIYEPLLACVHEESWERDNLPKFKPGKCKVIDYTGYYSGYKKIRQTHLHLLEDSRGTQCWFEGQYIFDHPEFLEEELFTLE